MPAQPPPDRNRSQALRAAMDAASMDLIALWAAYVRMGGTIGPDAIGRFLLGERGIDDHDHALLVGAVERRLLDAAEDLPRARPGRGPEA